MSGSGTARPRRRAWLGLVVGVVAVSGALVAVVHDGGSGGADPGGRAERSRWQHEYPASYAGPVWIEVGAADGATRTVTIRWGPWQRRILHEPGEPSVYEFRKDPTAPGDPTVPTMVTVEPAAEITFGSGAEPPPDAVDVNEGWTNVDDDA